MYKLTVVGGPNRGSSYWMQAGENSIGRQAGNSIVLQSARVSKRHCVLVVSDGEIVLNDAGSANGTFVNGVRSRNRPVGPGDRISVGEYILEISEPPSGPPAAAPPVAGLGKVLQFPVPAAPPPATGALTGGLDALAAEQVPKDLKGRASWAFEKYVMPVFYGFAMKHQWRVVAGALFATFVVLNVLLCVSPLLDVNRRSVIREMERRGRFMARDIAERNSAALSTRQETRTEIGLAEGADNVRMAMLLDLDGRIIAPASRANKVLAGGSEAVVAHRAAKTYREGREVPFVAETDRGKTLVVVEPVKVASSSAGRNVVIGMAVVSLDTQAATLQAGQMGTVYSNALIYSAALGALVLLILYRLTLKPFQVLGEEMDKALKGEIGQVTHEFKLEEFNGLWDMINSAIQRIPKTGVVAAELSAGSPEDYAAGLQAVASAARMGLVLLGGDRRVIYLSPLFEEISGIRAETAVGRELSELARDQALGAFVADLCDRAQVGTEGLAEDYDFSGVSYRIHAAVFGKAGDAPRAYGLFAARNEG